MPNMPTIQDAITALVQFRDERDWAQFHDSKRNALHVTRTKFLLDPFLMLRMFKLRHDHRFKHASLFVKYDISYL